jgi:hypothetical protein
MRAPLIEGKEQEETISGLERPQRCGRAPRDSPDSIDPALVTGDDVDRQDVTRLREPQDWIVALEVMEVDLEVLAPVVNGASLGYQSRRRPRPDGYARSRAFTHAWTLY